jgi:hypothetical protein
MNLGLPHDDPSTSIGNPSVSPSIRQRSRRSPSPRFIVASAWSDVDKGKGAPLGVECGEGVLASLAGGCVGFADALTATRECL